MWSQSGNAGLPRFRAIYRVVSFVSLLNSEGIGPTISTPIKLNSVSSVKPPISGARRPRNAIVFSDPVSCNLNFDTRPLDKEIPSQSLIGVSTSQFNVVNPRGCGVSSTIVFSASNRRSQSLSSPWEAFCPTATEPSQTLPVTVTSKLSVAVSPRESSAVTVIVAVPFAMPVTVISSVVLSRTTVAFVASEVTTEYVISSSLASSKTASPARSSSTR